MSYEQEHDEVVRRVIVLYLADRGKRARINFIHGAPHEYIENPTKALVELLQQRYALTAGLSKKMVACVIRDIETEGAVMCVRSGRGDIRMIKIVQPEAMAPIVVPANPRTVVRRVTTTPESVVAKPPEEVQDPPGRAREQGAPRRSFFSPRGKTKEHKERINRGDRNEQRFRALASDLVFQLNIVSHGLYAGTIEHSGRHHPQKGKYDRRDYAGEDVSISFSHPTTSEPIRLIYDVKSSYLAAQRFNNRIILFDGQRDAKIKKAIAVNPSRYDEEIVQEMIRDICAAGLDVTPYENIIIKYFLV